MGIEYKTDVSTFVPHFKLYQVKSSDNSSQTDELSVLTEDSGEKELIPFQIINIVSMMTLKKDGNPITVDIDALKQVLEHEEIRRFPCLKFRVDGKAVLLFRNGKIIFTGIKDYDLLLKFKFKIEKRLKDVDLDFTELELQIQNIVVMTNLNKMINLEMACLRLDNCIYEPEQFPAAIVRRQEGGTFLLFGNSKIIGLGMRSFDKIEESLSNFIGEIYSKDLLFTIDEDSDLDLEFLEELDGMDFF